ncbi:MAG: vWA domain-containing protein [Bacteroidia bacterium]
MKKQLVFCFFWSMLFLGLYAQPRPALTKQPIEQALNQHLEYVNAHIYALRFFHKSVSELNKSVNKYLAAAPADKTGRMNYEGKKEGSIITYLSPDILENDSIMPLLPDMVLFKIMQNQSLAAEDKSAMMGKTQKVQQIVEEIDQSSKALQQYFATAKHWEEPDMETAFRLMNRCEVLFFDFSEAKEQLYAEAKKIHDEKVGNEAVTPFTRSGKKMVTCILYARNILNAMRKQDRAAVAAMLPELKTAVADLKGNEKKYMEGVVRGQEGSATDPVERYRSVIRKAEIFVKVTEEFLHDPDVDSRYEDYSPEYYYYNVLLLSNYNKVGAGVIDEYNRFVALADAPMLKLTEEVNWMKLVMKKDRKPAPPKKEEPKEDPDKDVIVMQVDSLPKVAKTEPKPVEKPLPTPKVTPAPLPKPAPAKQEEAGELADAAPNNLVFLLDVSGSMLGAGKMPVLKESFKNLLTLMRPEDNIAIVTYSGNARVVLPSTPCTQKDKIIAAIEDLKSSGKSDVQKGLKTAYRTATEKFIKDGNNRIILATDGSIVFNDETNTMIQEQASADVRLTVFFFEEKEFQGTAQKLREAAEMGGGNYAYINKANANQKLIDEAKAVRKK